MFVLMTVMRRNLEKALKVIITMPFCTMKAGFVTFLNTEGHGLHFIADSVNIQLMGFVAYT